MDKNQKASELLEDLEEFINSYNNLKKRVEKRLRSEFLNREIKCEIDGKKYIIKENGIYSIRERKIEEYCTLRFDFLLDLFLQLIKVDFNVSI